MLYYSHTEMFHSTSYVPDKTRHQIPLIFNLLPKIVTMKVRCTMLLFNDHLVDTF